MNGRLCGLDLFKELPDDEETLLESIANFSAWGVGRQ